MLLPSMTDDMESGVLVPDLLPLELWHEIAGHAAPVGTDVTQIVSWLAVAPWSVARHMHAAVLALVFQTVDLPVDDGPPDPCVELLSRIVKRSEECVLAARSINVWERSAFSEPTDLAAALVKALPHFRMLRKFTWGGDADFGDREFEAMPALVLRTLMSNNTGLEILKISRIDPDTPQIDLAGLKQLVHAQIGYNSIQTSSTTILFPKTLRSLRLESPGIDGISTFESFANNASSLISVALREMTITPDFWSRQPRYTDLLRTIHLRGVTLSPHTTLDFSGIGALETLILGYIQNVPPIGSLLICIRAPDTLRNLKLSHVQAHLPWTGLLLGINISVLDSLELSTVTLIAEDVYSIFGSNIIVPATSSDPPLQQPRVPCNSTKLRLVEIDTPHLPEALQSSRLFPVLRDFECIFRSPAFSWEILHSLGIFLSNSACAVERLALFIVWWKDGDGYVEMVKEATVTPTFLTSLKTARHLSRFSVSIFQLVVDHPIFHTLGDALLRVETIELQCEEPMRSPFSEEHFQLLTKFKCLRALHIDGRYNVTILGQSDVERLAQSVPTLHAFVDHGKTWEIRRHGITGELQRVICTRQK
ncbi:hypothetical protein DFH07DRAFT_937386 [Mycena maculata]|uniref:Uncharacterized protein n=1 Tax=Mycena maculata TaxID=230809 RepID=A0AAD7JZE1_9AGAR|nr:hypothetical protein DFH07DRAFT_937386 [Mycena maculata]